LETVQTVLLVLQVLVAVSLVGFILLQHGKGADAGAAFGSGASATVFGARGAGNFLSRTTAVLAAVFLANSLALAYIAKERVADQKSLMEAVESVRQSQRAEKPVLPEPSVPLRDSAVPDLPSE
jgi:preprotein translocase subunit SecG